MLNLVKPFKTSKPGTTFSVLDSIQQQVHFKQTTMKKTILSVAIAAFFAACSPKTAEVKTDVTAQKEDTSGLAQFKQWQQQQQQLIDAPQSTEDVASFNTSAVQEEAQQQPQEVKTRVIYRNVPAKQQPVAKVSKPARRNATTTSRESSTRETAANSNAGSPANSGVSDGAGTGVSDAPAETADVAKEEKKGWSKAAKGAVIGAGSGAVLGAILTKDKAKGAVIGGIIGAGAGYALGRSKDKKDGRY
jgi:hypothetical protein